MSTKRTILALTGTRADYGIYKPVFDALERSASLTLELIVTGMHLKKEFGHTVDIIKKDGFTIRAALDTLTTEDTPAAMARYVARTLQDVTDVLEQSRPDMLLLLGDRGEMLAGAVAALEIGIPIAHLHGGEESGTVDDAMRHAITQMATVHLASTRKHADAVARMRNSDTNVHVTGAPALDAIRTFTPVPKEQLCAPCDLDPARPLALLLQHPDTLDPLSPEKQLQPTLDALDTFDGNIVIFGSNADAGGMEMNAMLQEFAQAKPGRAFLMSAPHETFLSWEAAADVLVGNSSSGIIEAASFGLPAVNIGHRQKGRTQSGNVIDVPYDADAIKGAIKTATTDAAFRSKLDSLENVYGDGQAVGRIVRILEEFFATLKA